MKKEIKKHSSRFQPDMYINTLGSLIICGYMFSKDKPEPIDINKTWRKIKKNPEKYINFWLDDPKFINKSLELFNMSVPESFPIAMVQSKYNVLFMPYFDGQLYPINENGIYPQTAKSGKIYPIDFSTNNIGTTNSVQNIDLEKKE
jgi:hypothetical protein